VKGCATESVSYGHRQLPRTDFDNFNIFCRRSLKVPNVSLTRLNENLYDRLFIYTYFNYAPLQLLIWACNQFTVV